MSAPEAWVGGGGGEGARRSAGLGRGSSLGVGSCLPGVLAAHAARTLPRSQILLLRNIGAHVPASFWSLWCG